jgi:hypothetical protein
LKKSQLILSVVLLAAIAALVVWARGRVHFDFAVFRSQVGQADWRRIAVAVGCIYLGYAFRSVRWALLLRHNKKVPLFSLLGTQVIGFTAVALIGRVADLVRPYLVAKKTGLPVSSQIAVYIVERLLDAGSMALVFSIAMFWVPTSDIIQATAHSGSMSHLSANHPFLGLFVVRYGGLALTLFGALFLFAIRLAGEAVASFFERTLGAVSRRLGSSVGNKIRTFHSGLDTMRSFADFAAAASLSLVMWLLITLAYLETFRAFVASPELAAVSLPKCVLLMIASGSASIIQLPVIGWFSQIGIVMLVLIRVLGASAEAATACAATLLLVTFISIVPVGLIWAQIDHISLRKVASESEHASEGLSENEVPKA